MTRLPHCDVNCTTACNAACVGCSHLAPVISPWRMSVDSMVRDLEALKPFLFFDAVCLVGGEPTLNPRLPEFIRAARNARVSDCVMVITNGRRLESMPDDFWHALSPIELSPSGALRLSIYPNLDEKIPGFAATKCEEFGVQFESIRYDEFYAQFKANPDDGVEAFRTCHWKTDCFSAHEGKAYLCPQSIFFAKIFSDLIPGEDGLPLADLTEEKLSAFLNRTEPLNACRHCSGGHSHAFPWKETRNKAEWIQAATVPVE